MNRLRWLCCLLVVGCADEQPGPIATDPSAVRTQVVRMQAITQLAMDETDDSVVRELLKDAEVFRDLPALEEPCVGIRVRIPHRENHAFLSFTTDWFNEHSDREVAAALLQDLTMVLSDTED